MVNKIKILGVDIDVLTINETIAEVEKFVIEKHPLHLMGVNADKLNLCQKDERLMEIVQKSAIINADGASVVLASKYLGTPLPERVAGIDLMQDLLQLSNDKGYTSYFFGAKQEALDDMISTLKVKYPKLKIVGSRNGYFTDVELEEIQKDIRVKQPDFVFVGITSPKKEYIVQDMLDNGVNSVFMGVGGSFDVLSGHIPRAPKWMQKANLEWLFRVANEPRRLFKRYFVGNVEFIRRIRKEKKRKNG